jgi:hypothetical protein
MMRPKTPRAQDVAYKAIIEATEKEKGEGKPKTTEEVLAGLVVNLAVSLKATTKVDIASPPKFKGDDTKWESWYKQLIAKSLPPNERVAKDLRPSNWTWRNRFRCRNKFKHLQPTNEPM